MKRGLLLLPLFVIALGVFAFAMEAPEGAPAPPPPPPPPPGPGPAPVPAPAPAPVPEPPLPPFNVKAKTGIVFDGTISPGEYTGVESVIFILPEKKTATVYLAHFGGFLYVAIDAAEPHMFFNTWGSPLNQMVVSWKISGDDVQDFQFFPFSAGTAPFVQRLKARPAAVECWAAKAGFQKRGHWQAEYKISFETLGLRPKSEDKGSIQVTITGQPLRGNSPSKTQYPDGRFREVTSPDKWGEALPDEKSRGEVNALVKEAEAVFAKNKELLPEVLKIQNADNDTVLKIKELAGECLKLDPSNYIVAILLGQVSAVFDNNINAAAERFEAALKINASLDEIRDALVSLYVGELNQPDKAIALLKVVADADPKDSESRRALASIYADKLGQKDKALARIKEIADADPKNSRTLLEYVSYFGNYTYKFAEAAALAAEGAKKFPDMPEFLFIEGQFFFYADMFDNAEEVLKSARDLATKKNIGEFIGEINKWLSHVADYKKYSEEEKKFREDDAKANDLPQVKLETSKGDVILELYENDTPNTVANFISLVEKGFYDGTKFHRVMPGFMAQGGDPRSRGDNASDQKVDGPGYEIRTELSKRKHFRGVISMANSGPDTDGSQFFLTTVHTAWLNGLHGIFGRIAAGQEVVDSLVVGDVLKKATVIRKRDHAYEPKKK